MPRTVLVVEDGYNDLELTLLALEQMSLANPVIAVDSGPAALDFLAKLGPWSDDRSPLPAFILLDLNLRLMSGLQVLDMIRAHPVWRRIPVVMVSSSSLGSDIARAYDRGANAYVIKPMEFADYVEAIRTTAAMWARLNVSPLPLAA